MRIAARIKKLERSAIASGPVAPQDRCAGCDRPIESCRMSFKEVAAAFSSASYDERVATLTRPSADRCRFCSAELPPPSARPDADRLNYEEFAARSDAWDRLGRDDQLAVVGVLFNRAGRLAGMPMDERVAMLREWAADCSSSDPQQ